MKFNKQNDPYNQAHNKIVILGNIKFLFKSMASSAKKNIK